MAPAESNNFLERIFCCCSCLRLGCRLARRGTEARMIGDWFDEAMRLRMEFALELACRSLPPGRQDHETRKQIAEAIMLSARRGATSLDELMQAGRSAISDLLAA